MKALETKIPPPVVTFLFLILIFVFKDVTNRFSLPYQNAIALFFLILGFVFAASAMRVFKKNKTTINPLNPEKATALVVIGVFKRSRNPMYFGLLNLLLSFSIYLGSFSGFFFIPLFITYIHFFQIIPEEKAMEKLFGNAFKDYCSKVRRWI